jgi:sugar fermentation stimulation protein A
MLSKEKIEQNTLTFGNMWKRGTFRDRPNRFTVLLDTDGKVFKAYLPNTGRLEEYCVDGAPFFVVPFRSDKFHFKVISTSYQGNFVLLDTILMNRIVHKLLDTRRLSGIGHVETVLAEQNIGKSRFDFLLQRRDAPPLIAEVKTCTLSHNRVALFPDAPTSRARSHIDHMSLVHERGYSAVMIFIIPNPATCRLIPNFHTDPEFANKVLDQKKVSFRAYSFRLIDPVTVDLGSLREVFVDTLTAQKSGGNRGSYLLVLENEHGRRLEIGNLGKVLFPKGYYVYAGSAMNSLESRVSRHRRKRKNKHWHIDYITPEYMVIRRVYLIRRRDRIEPKLVRRMRSISSGAIPDFGASDSCEKSHLLYFQSPPFRDPRFLNILLDFKTFTETGAFVPF